MLGVELDFGSSRLEEEGVVDFLKKGIVCVFGRLVSSDSALILVWSDDRDV